MKLALGTVQFGMDYGVANRTGRVAMSEVKGILDLARQSGFDTLDTAAAYGDSEAVLGTLGVPTWKVVTKLPATPTDCINVSQWVKEQVKNSLHRLELPKLHGLLLHRPEQLLGKSGTTLYDALQELKALGLVNKIGVSVYGIKELSVLFDKYNFELIQAPLNIVDRSLVDSGWLSQLKNAGVEIHTRSAFLQGLLLMSKTQRNPKFGLWKHIWNEWDRWLLEVSLTPLQACLQFVISHAKVDRVVVGVDSLTHLEEIIFASKGQLSSLPAFESLEDDRLINPATWSQL